jgi:hypothetical protein
MWPILAISRLDEMIGDFVVRKGFEMKEMRKWTVDLSWKHLPQFEVLRAYQNAVSIDKMAKKRERIDKHSLAWRNARANLDLFKLFFMACVRGATRIQALDFKLALIEEGIDSHVLRSMATSPG